jgi:hypothetical protein
MMDRMRACLCLVITLFATVATMSKQADLYEPLDKILDMYVRDGYVYYLALKKSRAPLDRYVASLDIPRKTIESWSRPDQEAFWINGYNALVLRTVIDAYPIAARSQTYPPKSIRQVPGAFEQTKHRIAGESLTLDEIETGPIAAFGDPSLLLALGRGAIGSGRLKSEVYRGADIDKQVNEAVKECATRVSCFKVDESQKVVRVSPLFSWREKVFAQSTTTSDKWANRSPIERAVVSMMFPYLFQGEQQFLTANTWQMQYGTFDWRLNDLTGGVPE